MTISDAAALIGAIGVVEVGFVATMTFIEIVRQRSIVRLNINYVPKRGNRIEPKRVDRIEKKGVDRIEKKAA